MGMERDEQQAKGRKRARCGVVRFLAVASGVLVVGLIGVTIAMLLMAQTARGPVGGGHRAVQQAYADAHRRQIFDARTIGETEAARLFTEFRALTVRAADIASPFVPGAVQRSIRPEWDVDALRRLQGLVNDAEVLRDRAETAAALQMAVEEGVLEALLGVDSFRGAYPAASRQSSPEGLLAGASATLLHAAYIDAIERGDELAAARAMLAMRETVAIIGDLAPYHSQGLLSMYSRWYRVQFDTIELGLMTPTLASELLNGMRPIGWAAIRVRHARDAALGPLLMVTSEGEHFPRGERIGLYGGDGRVRLTASLRSLFGPVGGPETLDVVLPRAGFGIRHATLEEIADRLPEYFEASVAYFRPSRIERGLWPASDPPAIRLSGVAFPAIPVVGSPFIRFADANETYDNTLRIALAIEIYRSEHGSPPPALDDLVPAVLDELPINTWNNDGKFLYRLDPASDLGYVLYVPGPSGVDRGGVAPPGGTIMLGSSRDPRFDDVILPQTWR